MIKKTILNKEIIGKNAIVVDSKNKTNIGIQGKIVDETKFTLTIKDKKLMKKNITLKLDKFNIVGERLIGRPHERVKAI